MAAAGDGLATWEGLMRAIGKEDGVCMYIICVSIYLSIHIFFYLSIYIYLSIYLSGDGLATWEGLMRAIGKGGEVHI